MLTGLNLMSLNWYTKRKLLVFVSSQIRQILTDFPNKHYSAVY